MTRHVPRHRTLLAIALAASLSPAVGFAQQSSAPADQFRAATDDAPDERERRAASDTGAATQSAATQLDKVVVRGLSGAATLRSVSSPISVMTAEDIERKQALNLTDLLRGQLPGMSMLMGSQNDWTTIVNARGNTGWNPGLSDLDNEYMKILIDDVEVVRPTLLSMIDPKSIEQIEIVRGPLAGAMYGAEGSSGVMRITTKKGRPGQAPEFVAQLAAGVIESDYKSKDVTPLVIDKSLQVIGGGDAVSYRLGVSETDVGAWVPGYDSKTRMASGAAQGMWGPFDVSVSGIHSDRSLALSVLQLKPECAGAPAGGECASTMDYPMSETLFATTIGYEASPDWQHTLTFGYDQNKFGYEGMQFDRVSAKTSDYERRTVRYFTNYSTDLSEDFSGRFTLGADLVLYRGAEAEGGAGHDHGDDAGHSHNVVANWRNLGYYGVAELGFRDRLYLTLAGRLEQRLRKVSSAHDSPFQPRAGLSYVFGGEGDMTVKARVQWGTSARAPVGQPFATANNYLLPVDLRPEDKSRLGCRPGFHVGRHRYAFDHPLRRGRT